MKFTPNFNNQMILICVICANQPEAEKIGKHLLKKKFTACVNIFPESISPFFYWSPKSEKNLF